MLVNNISQLTELPKNIFRARVHYTDGTVVSRRIWNDSDPDSSAKFLIYAKGKRRYARWYHSFKDEVVAFEPIITTPVDEATKWQKSWAKALRMLEASGLWEEFRSDIETGLSIGYHKIKQAYDIYWKQDGQDERVNAVRQIDDRLISKTPTGVEYVSTHIVWDMHPIAKIKKMYFGKDSQHYLNQIAEAMRDKKKFRTSARASYDVSFEYNPEKKLAWYSEEYRNCGNGHYYLALNATHALFSEDD